MFTNLLEKLPLSSQSQASQNRKGGTIAQQLLKGTAAFWFVSVLIGQWLFFYYIMSFYGYSVITDNMEIWNRWEPLGSKPYEKGDTGGNLAFAFHTIGAGIIAFGGALQLFPQVRNKFPTFHKINGYVYLITVLFLALSGFYLVWVRGNSPDVHSAIGTTINGFLILGFAFMALYCVKKRDIKHHRQWAMRLYLVSNAQWFLRVGTFGYLIGGSILGMNPGFGDLFFSLWTFGCYVLPLAALQLYFYAMDTRNAMVKYATSGILAGLTVFMITGLIGLTPFLQKIVNGEAISL